ncbi:hypothetical protein C9374_007835 [Naegleria lovaniensis]|uniref:EF-hand domain-containing protein n=1 Tax=Naegleria lovaniensis TaxID=51637 RepID=A0AA88KFW1_NAELO|nr:uncharacterized protein C9374_007835 [Naegleria lovaniensis]KAG2378687.1 hypothetical protein C9374_007835 [Naegleria lovaniensis]
MVRRHHHHHHHHAGLVGLGLGLLGGVAIASAVASSEPTTTITTRPSSVFWHGTTCPRWLPVGFVVPQHFYTHRSTWITQAQSLFYQHVMFGANYLNKRGFKRAMACLGLHKHQAKHLFFMMDTDRNGVITLDEFINAYLFVMSGGMAYKGTGFTVQPVVTSTVYCSPQPPPQQPGYYQPQPPSYQPPFNPQSAYLPQSQPQYVPSTQVYQQPQHYMPQPSVPPQNQIYQQPNTFN